MFQGFITGFREGLEAFLVLAVMVRYLDGIGRNDLKLHVRLGFGTGVIASAVIGAALFLVSRALGADSGLSSKLWEAASGLVAAGLVTTFVVWMIRHGSTMTKQVERGLSARLSPAGVFLIALFMTAREGTEIAVFAFASPDGVPYLLGTALGIGTALILAIGLYFSLVKVKLSVVFAATTVFLIVQAGFILGYSIHEFLDYLKVAGLLDSSSPLLVKLFNVSKLWGGILDHKTGALGAPLYAIAGWYSRPEWLQFTAQYAYTAGFLIYWRKRLPRKAGVA
ncbi:MAG: FTR1 family protein [Rectinema sp.]